MKHYDAGKQWRAFIHFLLFISAFQLAATWKTLKDALQALSRVLFCIPLMTSGEKAGINEWLNEWLAGFRDIFKKLISPGLQQDHFHLTSTAPLRPLCLVCFFLEKDSRGISQVRDSCLMNHSKIQCAFASWLYYIVRKQIYISAVRGSKMLV